MADDFILSALAELFPPSNNTTTDLSNIDGIVLLYIKSILEEFQEDDNQETFDAETFISVISPYFPGSESPESVKIHIWLIGLSGIMKNISTHLQDKENLDSNASNNNSIRKRELGQVKEHKKQHHKAPNTARSEANSKIDFLQEMFPTISQNRLRTALKETHGDVEKAINTLLQSQDPITELTSETENERLVCSNDKDVKRRIVSNYSFVDVQSDNTFHKPCEPKKDSTKMLRYRDGKVVSTKGEKYQMLKEEESEDMKKTFINLKPARKYRFH